MWREIRTRPVTPPEKAMSNDSAANDAANAAMAPSRGAVLLVAAVLGAILAGTGTLWAHYGTAVFFETIRTGFAACFG
jgi:hypothetical protein